VREIAGFSWSVFLANASAEIQLRSDEVVIAAALPVSRLAPYAIARRLTTVPTQLAWQFAEVLLPVASALDGRDDDLRDLHVVGTRVTLGLFLPFACALGVLSERFIEAWIGPEYVSAASVLITIMLVAALLDAATWTGSQICQALLRHRPLAALAVAGTVLNLGLSIALVGPLGVTGVALATLIATSLESLLFVLPYSLRVTGVPARRMVREVMAPTACAAAATIGALAGLVALVDPRSTPALALVGAIGAVVYAAIHLSFAACAHERGLAATAWRRGLARVPGRGRED
jgi:putative peptidoglycan lipid II flippase